MRAFDRALRLPMARAIHTFRSDNSEDSALFWLFASILAALAALALAWPFWVSKTPPASRAEHDVEAFRAQLREVDQDLARGVLTEAEADSARIELSRRLLAAAETAETEAGANPAPRGLARMLGLIAAMAVPLIGLSVYAQIGSPDAPDRPLASRDFAAERPSQAQAEAQFLKANPRPANPPEEVANYIKLLDQVRERLKEAPDDARGWELLATSSRRLGFYDDSWHAFAKLAELAGDTADAGLYGDIAETMSLAAGGYMSPEAEAAIDRALEIDPDWHQAIFFKSKALAQRGDFEPAIEGWAKMLKTAPDGAPWITQVQDDIRAASIELGVEPPADLVPPGPTRAERAAAAEMSEEDRNAMIVGMVEGLAARLEDDPNDLTGWLRLIRAYSVMGRDDDAKAAQATALETFSDDADAQAKLKDAL